MRHPRPGPGARERFDSEVSLAGDAEVSNKSHASNQPTRIDFGYITAEEIETESPLAHALTTAFSTVCGKHTGAGSICVTCRNFWARDRAPGAYGIITVGEQPDSCHVMLICEDCTAAADGNVADLVRDFGEAHLGFTDFHRAPDGGRA